MPYIVLASELAFQKTMPNNVRLPDGPEEIVYRGNAVPDYVTEFVAASLLASGLIAWANQPDPIMLMPDPVQPIIPGQPPVQPTNPDGVIPYVGDITGGVADVGADPVVVDVPLAPEPDVTQQLPALPKASDTKETWEAYAELPQIGIAAADAESMTKTDLMAQVKARYAEVTA